jgi:hypothetical protein
LPSGQRSVGVQLRKHCQRETQEDLVATPFAMNRGSEL